MALCKNQVNPQETLKTKLGRNNFVTKMEESWMKLKN
jgi:hypothetical protein